MNYGRKIRTLKDHRLFVLGKKQSALSIINGLSAGTLSRLEQGKAFEPLRAKRYASAYELSLEAFLELWDASRREYKAMKKRAAMKRSATADFPLQAFAQGDQTPDVQRVNFNEKTGNKFKQA